MLTRWMFESFWLKFEPLLAVNETAPPGPPGYRLAVSVPTTVIVLVALPTFAEPVPEPVPVKYASSPSGVSDGSQPAFRQCTGDKKKTPGNTPFSNVLMHPSRNRGTRCL